MVDDEDTTGTGSGFSNGSRRKSRKREERKRSHKHKRRHKEERRHDRRKRHKDQKERDRDKRTRRKHRHRKSTSSEDESVSDVERNTGDSRTLGQHEDAITQTLCSLFEDRPVFSCELPIIFIRLAGGATFDLRQMTDETAASRLEQVFESLQMFGVQRRTTNNHWIFRNPTRQGGVDELILLRLVRSVLDNSGLTMEEIKDYERKLTQSPGESNQMTSDARQQIKTASANLLHEFKHIDSILGQQLVPLCRAILEGECICIDGLPNERLRDKLASLFQLCGLEKSEMEDSEDDDDNDDKRSVVMMGYNLPEDDDETVRINLQAFIDECRRHSEKPHRRLVGPQRLQNFNADITCAIDDDEGPLPVGSARRLSQTPKMQPAFSNAHKEGLREEWMLVPGENDFLSSIKSGHSIRSRGFKNQKLATEPIEEDINPEIRREIDSIKAAHTEARGPSLMTQHRASKQDKDDATAEKGKWKWSRDKDLDSGRKVDKNALKMILGGAGSDLQSKFHGTYDR